MKTQEALKIVKTEKPEIQLFEVSFGYSSKLILPHKAMMQFMDALTQAEVFEDNYGKEDKIRAMETNDIAVRPMSRERYYDIKAATLLNVRLDEFIEAKKEAA